MILFIALSIVFLCMYRPDIAKKYNNHLTIIALIITFLAFIDLFNL